MKRILSLVPNNPDPYIAAITGVSLLHTDFFQEADRKMCVATLAFLFDTWTVARPVSSLFAGTCLLTNDKTVSGIAAEIWIKTTTAQSMDNLSLGKIIGKQLAVGFAPVKRFTDLAIQSLMNISTCLNEELKILIETIRVELPDEPLRNLKKLLELYLEICAVTRKQTISTSLSKKLAGWAEKSALRGVVQKVL